VRLLKGILLIAALVGIGIAMQHIIFAGPSSTTVSTTLTHVHAVPRCTRIIEEVGNVSVPQSLHEELEIDPGSVFAKTIVAPRSGLLSISIEGASTHIRVFVVIENGDQITVVQPRTSISEGNRIEYLVYVPRGISTVVLLNDGSSKAFINVDIEFR